MKLSIRIESLTSVLSSQSNHVMMKHIEREALPEVSFEARLEEVVAPFEEIPSMVKLYTPKPGEIMVLTLGAEYIISSGRREDGSRANCASDELVVLANDGTKDGRVESGHGVDQEDGTGGGAVRLFHSSRIGGYIPSVSSDTVEEGSSIISQSLKR